MSILRKVGKAGVVVAALLALHPLAYAVPIHGEISFAGSYSIDNANLNLATKFNSFTTVTVGDGPIGDYAGTAGQPVTMQGFTFSPFSSAVVPLWTFTVGGTTYSFDLDALSIDFRSTKALALSGSGVAHVTGRDDTLGD